MPSAYRQSRRGFTLIELMVALFILAMLGIMSWRATSVALDSRDQIMEVEQRWQRLSRGFALLENNLLQAAQRQASVSNGFYDFNLLTNDAGEQRLIFWRTEATHGARLVGFRVRDGNLQLLRWTRGSTVEEPEAETILQGVQKVKWSVLNSEYEWQDSWQQSGLPLGIRIALDIDKTGHIDRVFALH